MDRLYRVYTLIVHGCQIHLLLKSVCAHLLCWRDACDDVIPQDALASHLSTEKLFKYIIASSILANF